MALDEKRPIFGWAMYDWANSAFATTVMAGFFPVFFKQFWSKGVSAPVSTARLGMANSIAGIIVALLAPILGAIADRGASKVKFLFFFAFMGVVMTLGLFLVREGNWPLAIILYIFASIGFSGGNIFYDALIKGVASARKMDFVSALGFSMGYLGGGILFAINVMMALKPETFGFATSGEAVRFSFLTVGLWWALFSAPIFLFVREPASDMQEEGAHILRQGLGQIRRTFQRMRRLKNILLFLIAYFIYIDGVDTIIRMAVDYGMSIGFEANDLIVALLITQFVGFPSAMAFGVLSGRIGCRRSILLAISIYFCAAIWGAFMGSKSEFYILAVVIGLVQGGIQALSRSYYAIMIPAENAAEYFGFYNMVGKFAVVLGPFFVGAVGLFAQSLGFQSQTASRIGIASLALFFIAGGSLFCLVKEETA